MDGELKGAFIGRNVLYQGETLEVKGSIDVAG